MPNGTVTGMTTPGKLKAFIAPDGAFTKASSACAAATRARGGALDVRKNPFVEHAGVVRSGDPHDDAVQLGYPGTRNNRILTIDGRHHYIVSDLGATFGKMGVFPVPRSKWNLEDFRKEEFIEKVDDGKIDLDYEGYGGYQQGAVEHARWFSRLASQLTDDQLRAALRASGRDRCRRSPASPRGCARRSRNYRRPSVSFTSRPAAVDRPARSRHATLPSVNARCR